MITYDLKLPGDDTEARLQVPEGMTLADVSALRRVLSGLCGFLESQARVLAEPEKAEEGKLTVSVKAPDTDRLAKIRDAAKTEVKDELKRKIRDVVVEALPPHPTKPPMKAAKAKTSKQKKIEITLPLCDLEGCSEPCHKMSSGKWSLTCSPAHGIALRILTRAANVKQKKSHAAS